MTRLHCKDCDQLCTCDCILCDLPDEPRLVGGQVKPSLGDAAEERAYEWLGEMTDVEPNDGVTCKTLAGLIREARQHGFTDGYEQAKVAYLSHGQASAQEQLNDAFLNGFHDALGAAALRLESEGRKSSRNTDAIYAQRGSLILRNWRDHRAAERSLNDRSAREPTVNHQTSDEAVAGRTGRDAQSSERLENRTIHHE